MRNDDCSFFIHFAAFAADYFFTRHTVSLLGFSRFLPFSARLFSTGFLHFSRRRLLIDAFADDYWLASRRRFCFADSLRRLLYAATFSYDYVSAAA